VKTFTPYGGGVAVRRWRDAMEAALYGPGGFFVGPDRPADHFRTSVHAGPVFAGAILRLVSAVDAALGHPRRLDVVDVGAGRGELLAALGGMAGGSLGGRLRLVAVEKAGRPGGLPGGIEWRDAVPDRVDGVLLGLEWLDNVPVDVVEVDPDGVPRVVLVDGAGRERLGGPVDVAQRFWMARWWPLDGCPPGSRAEIGDRRDAAWAEAVGAVRRGVALAVDYGHLKGARPGGGTLSGYRAGRQVAPLPDGSTDVTALVAMDAVAAASGRAYCLVTQREALRALGVDGRRPPVDRAAADPAGYVRALAAAGLAAELTDPGGLGAHWWLAQPVGLDGRGIIPW
jgi:SAM-dependent MidA family methyltransferase